MNEEKMSAVSVHLKDRIHYQCHQCGQCCRNIENSVMVESIDAFYLTKYLSKQTSSIHTIADVLDRYCVPMPLTEMMFPIFMLKTIGLDHTCIFLKNGRCSIYDVRPRTCRIYPFSIGPGERGRNFEYCLCFDRNQNLHFNGHSISVKDWFYKNVLREEKEYLKLEYESVEKIGQLMRSLPLEACEKLVFQILFYRYYNFDLNKPFLAQYKNNTNFLLEKLSQTHQMK